MASTLDAAGRWAWAHPGVLLVGSAGVYVTLWAWQPLTRWRLRTIPTKPVLPVLGHLHNMEKKDVTEFMIELQQEFPIACQFWAGGQSHVLVNDVELGRTLLARNHIRPTTDDIILRHGEDRVMWNSSVIFTHGTKWRVARRAFEAALLHPKSLNAQAPYVAQCAARLCARLEWYASSGEPVDVLPLVYAMTLDAVGFAAFGLDLASTTALGAGQAATSAAGGGGGGGGGGSSSAPGYQGRRVACPDEWWLNHPLGSPEFGASLVQCAVGVMQGLNMAVSSVYSVLGLMFPGLMPLWRLMSFWFPDQRMRQEQRDFRGLREACKVIVQEWRAQRGDQAVISEQGFLARLLSEVQTATGAEKLTDVEVVGNTIALVAAGYETTGASIASSLYLLAHNPAAHSRLQQEVDQVVGDKEVTPEDLEQMPYLNAVFMETQRLHPSANVSSRIVTERTHLAPGLTVPRGCMVLVNQAAFMVDPKVWGPTALDFLPERHIQPGHEELAPTNPAAMMPFGAGSRMCVGYKFAQLEARMGLARLLQRFTFSPAPGAPEPRWVTSMAYSPDRVILTVEARQRQ